MARSSILMAGRQVPPSGCCLRQRLAGRHAAFDLADRLDDAGHRGLGDFVAIEARFRGRTQIEIAGRPDVAGVERGIGLDQRGAPRRVAFEDRPVERGRAAVADGSGMDNQAAHRAPSCLRDGATQEWRNHKIRPKQAHCFGHAVVVDVELDGELVTALGELDVDALGQRIKAGGEQQDAHRALSRCAATARRRASRSCARRRCGSPCARSAPGRRSLRRSPWHRDRADGGEARRADARRLRPARSR